MECLNKVELIGTVGNVRISEVSDSTLVKFAVATNYCYKSKDGCAVIETTWHYCSAWTCNLPNAAELAKGSKVHLFGRIRTNNYIGVDGVERTAIEILVNKLDIIG